MVYMRYKVVLNESKQVVYFSLLYLQLYLTSIRSAAVPYGLNSFPSPKELKLYAANL